MIEFLKILAESLLKWLSPETLRATIRQKRLREIGAELFLLYSSLNEIYVTALSIIKEIEVFSDFIQRKALAGKRKWEYRRDPLKTLLRQQKVAIGRLCQTLNELRHELKVLSPEVYSVLEAFFEYKRSMIDSLEGGLFYTQDKYGRLIDTALKTLPEQAIIEAAQLVLSSELDALSFKGSPIGKTLSRYRAGVINIDPNKLNRGASGAVSAFLATEPRQKLEVLKQCLVQLRSILEKTFSIQDVLLEVGDRRAQAF